MLFDEASLWCTDHRVRVTTLEDGRRLRLVSYGVSVEDTLPDDRWETWRDTFTELTERLRDELHRSLSGPRAPALVPFFTPKTRVSG
jgi:hypothetical protein